MWKFNYKCFVFITFIFILLYQTTYVSYAGVWTNNLNGWNYTKNNGSLAKNEILLDDTGEIYCFDENGIMLRNKHNKDGLYFGDSGAWVNPTSTNSRDLNILWNEFISNGSIAFSSKSNLVDALNYYSYSKLITIPRNISVVTKDNNFILSSTTLKGDLDILNQYSTLLNSIAVTLKGNNEVETIQNIINYIVGLSSYDITQDSAYSLLNSGLGCCSAYSQLFNILCSYFGYSSETVCVYVEAGYHCLNRVLIDNVWHYYDVTFYDSTQNSMYLDINNDILLNIYTLSNKGIFGN